MDLHMQLLRAERMTNHFRAKGDEQMFAFWARLYYYLRRKVHEEEERTWNRYNN